MAQADAPTRKQRAGCPPALAVSLASSRPPSLLPSPLPPPPDPAVIDKAVNKGVLHKNTAARRKARMAVARQNVLIAAGLYTPAQ